MMNELEKAYMTMQDACGIEVGDTVKVLRKAESHECGWDAAWAFSMDEFVGGIGVVEHITGHGVTVLFSGGTCFLPFFVLEKIPKPHWRDTVSPENPVLCYVRDNSNSEWMAPTSITKYNKSFGTVYPYRSGINSFSQAKRVPKEMIESMLEAYDETSEDE